MTRPNPERLTLSRADSMNSEENETTYRVQDSETVTEAVVRAVNAERQSDGTAIEPLYSVIDTEALNELFAPLGDSTLQSRRTNGTVTFSYDGFRIRATSDGTIGIRPNDPE